MALHSACTIYSWIRCNCLGSLSRKRHLPTCKNSEKSSRFYQKGLQTQWRSKNFGAPPQKFFGAPVLAEISKIVTRSTPENIAFFWEKLIKSNDFTISQFSSFSSSEGAPSSALWAPHCGLRPPATAGSAGMLGGPPLHKPTTPGNMVLNITIACKASSEIAIPGE